MGQGFGVVMIDNTSSKTFTIPKDARTHTTSTSVFHKKNSIENYSFILKSISNNVVDDIKFSFNESASNNYDVEYDAFKLKSFGVSPTPSFITDDGYKLSICEMPNSKFINLGFSMGISGEVTFSIVDANNFGEIILEDKSSNQFIDLLQNTYTFNYLDDEKEIGRFVLHFKQETLNEVEQLIDLNVYSNQGDIYIKNHVNLSNVKINIYSISGLLVHTKKYTTLLNTKIQTTLKGVYILEIKSDEGVTTTKISLN